MEPSPGTSQQGADGQPPTPPTRPPTLRPPTSGNGSPQGPKTPRATWIVLALVSALALAVVIVLPHLAPGPDQSTTRPFESRQTGLADSSAPASAPASEAKSETRRQAEQTLQKYLEAKARLGLDNAEVWGPQLWSHSLEAAQSGDRMFGVRDFDAAAKSYAEALTDLESLDSKRAERLKKALEQGRRALNDNDIETAELQLKIALAIDADNVQGLGDLALVRVRRQVLSLTEQGKQAEADNNMKAARDAYADAVELDNGFEEANSGLTRVTKLIADFGFRQSMSQALAAIAEARLGDAAKALARATSLRPQSSAVADAKATLELATQRAKLVELRRKANGYVASENWNYATEAYKRALAVEPKATFALNGAQYAAARARLNEQLSFFLARPERLYSPEPRMVAQRLIKSAGQPTTAEPKLAAKLVALKTSLKQASEPVAVTLRSDGLSEIVIYHIGRLGRFENRDLELTPGDYVATASRNGYRDARVEFSIKPGAAGAAATPIDIRCKETL